MAQPVVMTIQPEFSPLLFFRQTLATTPSPKRIRIIVPTISARNSVMGVFLYKCQCRGVAFVAVVDMNRNGNHALAGSSTRWQGSWMLRDFAVGRPKCDPFRFNHPRGGAHSGAALS